MTYFFDWNVMWVLNSVEFAGIRLWYKILFRVKNSRQHDLAQGCQTFFLNGPLCQPKYVAGPHLPKPSQFQVEDQKKKMVIVSAKASKLLNSPQFQVGRIKWATGWTSLAERLRARSLLDMVWVQIQP